MAQSMTARTWRRWPAAAFVLLAALALSGCGVNNIPTLDEAVKASWAQVLNQYQRRADLIPNLVETVRGYAAQERETLTDDAGRFGYADVTPGLVQVVVVAADDRPGVVTPTFEL